MQPSEQGELIQLHTRIAILVEAEILFHEQHTLQASSGKVAMNNRVLGLSSGKQTES